jgi:hypothetical protein
VRVYISGPMRGLPDYNYPVFHAVAEEIAKNGVDGGGYPHEDTPLNPAANYGGDTSRDITEYMQQDLHQVLSADALVLLPGWERSEGAQLEIRVASAVGKRFFLALPPGPTRPAWQFLPIEDPRAYESPRASALAEAKQLVTDDRNNAYGPPVQDFSRTAAMASAYGFQVNGRPLQGHDVAIFQNLLKTSRLVQSPGRRDTWVDIAGYAGCGYECAADSERYAA